MCRKWLCINVWSPIEPHSAAEQKYCFDAATVPAMAMGCKVEWLSRWHPCPSLVWPLRGPGIWTFWFSGCWAPSTFGRKFESRNVQPAPWCIPEQNYAKAVLTEQECVLVEDNYADMFGLLWKPLWLLIFIDLYCNYRHNRTIIPFAPLNPPVRPKSERTFVFVGSESPPAVLQTRFGMRTTNVWHCCQQ